MQMLEANYPELMKRALLINRELCVCLGGGGGGGLYGKFVITVLRMKCVDCHEIFTLSHTRYVSIRIYSSIHLPTVFQYGEVHLQR